MTIEKLRAWWAHRQGLGTEAGRSAQEVLSRTGWARSVGGSAPYLTLFARAGLAREAVDTEVAAQRVCELPSARGCTYVLPAEDFAMGLTVGASAAEGEVAAAVKHLGVTHAEVEKLCQVVLAECATEPVRPDALRPAARGLGEAGKKRGLSTTLPLALGLLQARGLLRRVPVNGRLDQQRFGYQRWSPSPLAEAAPDLDTAREELARRYFRWAAPASLGHFRWFSGLTATAANKATAALDLTPAGHRDLLIPADLHAEFTAFEVPAEPAYALVAWIDGIHLLHRELTRLLDPADAARPEPAATRARTLGDLADPPCQLIVDRGRVVGLWEYDPGTEAIAHQLFVPPDDALHEAIARTERFARDQLGDVRGSSRDTPRSRSARIAALRGAAGPGDFTESD